MSVTFSVIPETADAPEINWSNYNAKIFMEAFSIGSFIERDYLCGSWDSEQIEEYFAKMKKANYKKLVRPSFADGNFHMIGIEEEGAKRRVRLFTELLKYAIDNNKTINFA